MLNRYIMLALALILGLNSYAQYGKNGKKVETAAFLKTTLVVVLPGRDPEFDNALKSHMTNEWTGTPVEFISQEDIKLNIKDYVNNDKYSFLTISIDKGAYSDIRNLFITINVSSRGTYGGGLLALVGTNTGRAALTPDAEALKDVQILKYTLFHNGVDQPTWSEIMTIKNISKEVQNSPIYVCKDVLPENKIDKFKESYLGHSVVVVDKEEFSSHVIEKKEGVLYVDCVSRNTSSYAGYITVIDAQTGFPLVHFGGARDTYGLVIGTLGAYISSLQRAEKKAAEKALKNKNK